MPGDSQSPPGPPAKGEEGSKVSILLPGTIWTSPYLDASGSLGMQPRPESLVSISVAPLILFFPGH